MIRKILFCLIALRVLVPRPALAQTKPQVAIQVDAETIGLGDVVHVTMSATSSDTMPTDPQIGATPGFAERGRNASPSETHFNINGAQTDRFTLTVDFVLQAQRIGTFKVGPPSIAVGGSRFLAQAITLHVVRAGNAPPRPARPAPRPSPFGFSFSPFDPWKGLFPGADSGDRELASPPDVTTDPKLSLDAPRGANFFLHATTDKTTAVLGEQVTLSVYAYFDMNTPEADISDDGREVQVADFVRHSLLRDDQQAPVAGFASIAGRTYRVRLLRRWALFPLRSGDLTIGSMTLTVVRPRAASGPRTSEVLSIHITEPPVAGRPPGFALGDVGRFALVAQVQPREVEQGGAISVHVELSGTGNVPSTIAAPLRDGLEWLAPEVHDDLGPIGHDAYGGKRSFDFIVRTKRAGNLDLGEIRVPFWDPETKRYGVARSSLGTIAVKASAMAAREGAENAPALLPGLPAPRDRLEGASVSRPHADDSRLFWLAGVGGGPLAFGVAALGRAAAHRLRRTWRTRRNSPAAELKQRLAAARAACGGNDTRAADAAIARALEAATVALAGVSIRGAVGSEVTERLARAGVEQQAAARVAELLRECEKARFAPDHANVVEAQGRLTRAQAAIRHLEKRA
jgi:hypothetical protein